MQIKRGSMALCFNHLEYKWLNMTIIDHSPQPPDATLVAAALAAAGPSYI